MTGRGQRGGADGEGGNGVGEMGRGAMGRGQQEGGDREVGKWEGEKKGHEEGGISQMDRNAWVDIWNAWVERDYRVFLLCLPVQRRVPQLVYTNKIGDCLFICLFIYLSICSAIGFQTARPNRLKFGG